MLDKARAIETAKRFNEKNDDDHQHVECPAYRLTLALGTMPRKEILPRRHNNKDGNTAHRAPLIALKKLKVGVEKSSKAHNKMLSYFQENVHAELKPKAWSDQPRDQI